MNFRTGVTVACSLMLVCASGQAANGDIDTSFGIDGIARTGLNNVSGGSITRPLVQPDGRILIGGTLTGNGSSGDDFLVARFNADGSKDTSFSFDGLATVDFNNGTDTIGGIALQSDGKIVVVGSTGDIDTQGQDFAVARLNADGSLDTSFGAGSGKVTIPFDLDGGTGNDTATAVALDGNTIVVAGNAETSSGRATAVVRLLPDGTRDSSFNLVGRVTFTFSPPNASDENDQLFAVAIDGAGRVVVAGTVGYTDATAHTQSEFAAARLLADGTLDDNFHANGRVTIPFDRGNGTSYAGARGLVLQADDRMVLVGDANSSVSATANFDVAAARLLPDGTLDGSFGTGGRVLVAFDLVPNGLDVAIDAIQRANGSLLLVGASVSGSGQEGLANAVRLTPNGLLDAFFGSVGKRTYDFALTSPDGQAFAGVTLQGSLPIAGGLAYVPPGGDTTHIDMFVARLYNDTIFANGFE